MLRRRVALVALEAVLGIARRAAGPFRASRAVLARIDAAEIALTFASPSTIARARHRQSRAMQSVDRAHAPAATASASTARRIASRRRPQDVERVDLLHRRARDRPGAARAPGSAPASSSAHVRRSSCFESSRPWIRRAGSRITAAAKTGPASGPRPASSTPQARRGSSTGAPAASSGSSASAARSAASQRSSACRRSNRCSIRRRTGSSASRFEHRLGQVLRRRIVLEELRHHRLAAQDVRQPDVRHADEPSRDPVRERRDAVGDHHRAMRQRRLERHRAARGRARRRRPRARRARGRRAASAAARARCTGRPPPRTSPAFRASPAARGSARPARRGRSSRAVSMKSSAIISISDCAAARQHGHHPRSRRQAQLARASPRGRCRSGISSASGWPT